MLLLVIQERYFMEQQERIAQYSIRYEGDWSKIAAALKNREPVIPQKITDPFITIFDEDYPEALHDLRFPPWVLFYRGNIELLKRPAVTIVGSRRMTGYGKRVTALSASVLSEKYVLVSGLAKGVDGIVHRTAIGCGGNTVGVIGCGLNTRYPRENEYLFRAMEKEQLILSEYPSSTGVKRHHFPWRNRILAALGQRVIVTQASLRSGTMGTVNEAMNLDREIWCFPYEFDDETGSGCNLLISQGANIMRDRRDLEEMNETVHVIRKGKGLPSKKPWVIL